MSQPKLIIPGQHVTLPPGQVSCEVHGELIKIAVQYPMANAWTVLDVETARAFADRVLSEADLASANRYNARMLAADGTVPA